MPTLFHRYNELLKRRPWITNSLGCGIFFTIGDYAAQSLFPKEPDLPLDHKRMIRAGLYGSCFFAPISVLWHGKTLPKLKNPFINLFHRKKMEQVPAMRKKLHFYDSVFRMGIDQLIFPGFVWIPLYNTVMVILAGRDDPFQVIQDKLYNNWWRVLSANWTVWPGFQLFNLYFIPVHLRIVALNVWATGWNTFLSFVHNTKGHGHGSGHRLEEIVDIDDDEQEFYVFYD
ncbi:Protein SYM1 [Candida viswanathii]|uniref:Protein SYM1 n=1 Tax=Candida viswanathii TaxID=5486 RepID=A0A367XN44_9ASCO|nr:Protein SYM1 [Candida viswanathii]